jgi:hypothetical protein
MTKKTGQAKGLMRETLAEARRRQRAQLRKAAKVPPRPPPIRRGK